MSLSKHSEVYIEMEYNQAQFIFVSDIASNPLTTSSPHRKSSKQPEVLLGQLPQYVLKYVLLGKLAWNYITVYFMLFFDIILDDISNLLN